MGTLGIHINYRPLRIGFCIKNQDLKALRHISVINAYLSGGLYNPIIVINDDDNEDKIKRKILSVKPDFLYVTDKSLKSKLDIFDRNYFPRPFQFSNELICEYEGLYFFQVLDIASIIRDIWENHMKVSPKEHSNCVLPKWENNDNLDLLFSLMFGSFDLTYKFNLDYEKSYIEGLKAKVLDVKKDSKLSKELFTKVTPMLFTTEDLTEHYSTRYRNQGFIIGKSDSFNDLVSYWNFRTIDPDALFLPINQLERFESAIELIQEQIVAISKKNPHDKHLDFTLYYSKDNEKAAKDIQEKYFNDPKIFREEFRENPYRAKYGLFQFEDQPAQGDVNSIDNNHFSIDFQLPNFKYSEGRFYPKRYFVTSYSFLSEYEYPKHALQLPNFCDLNEWYGRKICFHYDRFRIEPAGFGIITEDRTHFQTLHPIFLPELLKKLFERAEIKTLPSNPGKIAQQIIEQMRNIEGCRVFKITGVRKLLRWITPLNNKTYKQCCDKIADREGSSFPKFEDLFIESREEPKLTTAMTFDFLVKKKVFRAGVVILCTKCELESWISLNNFSDIIECPLCGNKFSSLKANPSGIKWHFRRSGLFGENNNQEGSVPVLLSLLQLARTSHDARIFTSHNLEFDSTKCELDVIVLDVNQNHFNKTPEVIIGECKDIGLREKELTQTIPKKKKMQYQIADKDIENMVNIKSLLDKSGFQTSLLFSTTAKRFSEDEIEKFKELEKQYINPILFTANELEPYHPYDRYKRELLPHSHAVSYDQIIQNSKFIYLEDRDPQSLLK